METTKFLWRQVKKINSEPVLFLFSVAYLTFSNAYPAFVTTRVCMDVLDEEWGVRNGTTVDFCHELIGKAHVDNDTLALLNRVQKRTADLMTVFQALENSPLIILALFFGAWSDLFGRRKMILINSIIATGTHLVPVLVAADTRLSINFMYLYSAVAGLFAFSLTIGTPALSIISDTVTDPKLLAVRFGYAYALQSIGQLTGSLLSAWVLQYNVGYLYIFCISCSCFGAIALYTTFCVRETLHLVQDKRVKVPTDGVSRLRLMFSLTAVKMSLGAYFKRRSGRRRCHLLISLSIFIVYFMSDLCTPAYVNLFIKHPPLSVTDSTMSWIQAMATTLSIVGSGFVPKLASLLSLPSTLVMLAGMLLSTARTFTLAFATHQWHVYLAYGLEGLAAMYSSGFRAFLLIQGERNESCRLMSLISSSEYLGILISNAIFNSIYSATVSWRPSFTFFVSGAIMIGVSTAGSWLHIDSTCLHPKPEENEEPEVSQDEKISDDNKSVQVISF